VWYNSIAERREIYRIRDWLLRTGLTGIISQKVGTNESEHRYSFLQFMVDCVVILRHQVVDGSAFRNLRVIKETPFPAPTNCQTP
jgi:circadian clock protein KaiC